MLVGCTAHHQIDEGNIVQWRWPRVVRSGVVEPAARTEERHTLLHLRAQPRNVEKCRRPTCQQLAREEQLVGRHLEASRPTMAGRIGSRAGLVVLTKPAN